MLCFAMIGTWRFGSEYDIYGSFETSLQTEFELLFGEFQEGWTDNRDMAAFNVIYLMAIFLLVLNFLLAIIGSLSACLPACLPVSTPLSLPR